jgi:hypothetical protein
MVNRRAFVGGALALAVAARPSRALAIETPGGPGRDSPDGRITLDAVDVVVAAQTVVRTVWRPPAQFPPFAPVAYYAGRGGDEAYPDQPAIWLNPDHPELVSPRASRLTDEIPLLTELLLASADVPLRGVPSLGLEQLAGDARRRAATSLADRIAVVAKYSPYPTVDDAEFARRAFAFAVLRQMTPHIGGVLQLPAPAGANGRSAEAAFYAGRDADPRAPRGWGVVYADPERVARDREGYDSLLRAFVLATADRQPPESEVKRAYDAALARDQAARNGDRWSARRLFAAPYVRQVAALFGR